MKAWTATEPRLVELVSARADPREVGNKAWNLGRLVELGLPAPPAAVLTTRAMERFMEANGIRDDAGPEEIRDRFRTSPIPPDVSAAIELARGSLGSESTLAVRSSATGEDSVSATFAGQFDSFLGVRTSTELEEAVRLCWASLWSDRAVSYRRARERCETGSMAVIVQELVEARFSGILFTVSPADDHSMLGEFVTGRGEALASGRVNPGRFRIPRSGGRPEVLARGDSDPRAWEALGPILERRDLPGMAAKVETSFGGPQDIEWAVDAGDRLVLLQARPIVQRASAPRTACLWSNANIAENFPAPVSPLLYSVASLGYYHYFRNLGLGFGISARRLGAMDTSFRGVIGVHRCRLYYNLTRIREVLRLAPMGNLLGDFFDGFVGSQSVRAGGKPPPPHTWASGLAECVRVPLMVLWQYGWLERRIRCFEERIDRYAERTRLPDLAGRSMAALGEDLRRFRDIRCHQWNDAALADTAAMVCYGVLSRLTSLASPEDIATPAHRLLDGSGGVVSVGSVTGLWDLAGRVRQDPDIETLFRTREAGEILGAIRENPGFGAFSNAFDAYLEAWGFRCSGELMLTAPSFAEDPEPLVDLLRSYALGEVDSPYGQMERSRQTSGLAVRSVLGRLRAEKVFRGVPKLLQGTVFRCALGATHRAVALRERARLKQALLYSRLRQIALAMGRRLRERGLIRDPDDVFFLTLDELDLLATGGAMHPRHTSRLVGLRREARAAEASMEPPDTFELGEGESFVPGGLGGEPADSMACPARLGGVSASGGEACGPASVLTDVRDAHRLARGQILVTRQTDPGWAPALVMAAGLVMERGGILSHGAVLAREFGIPAVVGVAGATRRIRSGSQIRVEGDSGCVEILD